MSSLFLLNKDFLIRGIFCVVLLILSFGCTAKYPVIGSFYDYDEVFRGEVNADLLTGNSLIEVEGEKTGLRCVGGSRVLHIPASNYIAGAFLIPYCGGQKGAAELQCDSGRQVQAIWEATSCTSGIGYGSDQYGNRFEFSFGMEEAEAETMVQPDGVADNFGRKTMAVEAGCLNFHHTSLPKAC